MWWRFAWAIMSFVGVEALICAMSALPTVVFWHRILAWSPPAEGVRVVVVALLAVPSYAVFALCLMVVSPVVTRLAGWRTPRDVEARIADMEWPVLTWARYMASIHVVRVAAGALFRGSPLWTAYLRLNGARVGRGVYVASVALSDYNLLEIGDRVVIGGDVHISGHTVERGVLKTAPVRLGRNVTIGVGSVVEIGVEAGPDCQIGALSFVPKHARLEARGVYAGIPVRRIG